MGTTCIDEYLALCRHLASLSIVCEGDAIGQEEEVVGIHRTAIVIAEVLVSGEEDGRAVLRTLNPRLGQIGAEALQVHIIAVETNIQVTGNRVTVVGQSVDGPFCGLQAFGSLHRLRASRCCLAERGLIPVAIRKNLRQRGILQYILCHTRQKPLFGIVFEGNRLGKGLSVVGAADVFCTILVLAHELAAGKGCSGSADGTLHPALAEPIGQTLDIDVISVDSHIDRRIYGLCAIWGIHEKHTVHGVPRLHVGCGWRRHQFVLRKCRHTHQCEQHDKNSRFSHTFC